MMVDAVTDIEWRKDDDYSLVSNITCIRRLMWNPLKRHVMDLALRSLTLAACNQTHRVISCNLSATLSQS